MIAYETNMETRVFRASLMNMTINIARDYSPFILGRYPTESAYNGQEFRDTLLLPAIRNLLDHKISSLIVDIDGIYSPDPSFLEEAFGGSIRELKKENVLIPKMFLKKLIIKYKDTALKKKIEQYIMDAINA